MYGEVLSQARRRSLAQNARDFGRRLPVGKERLPRAFNRLKLQCINKGQSEKSDWPFPFVEAS